MKMSFVVDATINGSTNYYKVERGKVAEWSKALLSREKTQILTDVKFTRTIFKKQLKSYCQAVKSKKSNDCKSIIQ